MQVEEKIDIGKGREEQEDGFERCKIFEKVERGVTDKQESFEQSCKIVEKVDAGVQHDGFFETSFEFSPPSEEDEQVSKEVVRSETEVVRKEWGSQTPALQSQDWSDQVEATGKVDFGVQVEISGVPISQIQRSLSSEEVDVDALLETEEKEESMVSLVILLEERVKELEGLMEKERRAKETGRKRRVEDLDKELRAVRLALQISLEESNLARLELEATKESRSKMEAGFLEERRIEEEKLKDGERRRRDLEVELEVAVSESRGLREQVARMEARIEELEGEVCCGLLKLEQKIKSDIFR